MHYICNCGGKRVLLLFIFNNLWENSTSSLWTYRPNDIYCRLLYYQQRKGKYYTSHEYSLNKEIKRSVINFLNLNHNSYWSLYVQSFYYLVEYATNNWVLMENKTYLWKGLLALMRGWKVWCQSNNLSELQQFGQAKP